MCTGAALHTDCQGCLVLSGDLWEEGEMMRLMKSNMEDGRMPDENLRRGGQVRPELVVVDPNDS